MAWIFRTLLICIMVVLVCLSGCTRTQRSPENFSETFLAMGGIPVEIVVNGISRESLGKYVASVKEMVAKWESELSRYNDESLINRIVRTPGQPVILEPHLFDVFSAAATAYELTNGAFDITVGPIIALWKNAEKRNVLPDETEIAQAVARTGFKHLQLDEKKHSVTLLTEGIQIDVGGIAKGLFAQWIAEEIHREAKRNLNETLKKLLVNPGGDMFCLTPDREAVCTVGIQDPFGPGVWGELRVRNTAVVTSGTYQRHFEINGRQYCHIVDPRTGRPIETHLRSVTIVDPSGAMADALATACFVLGEPACWEMLAKREESAAIVIRDDRSWKASESIREKLDVTGHLNPSH